LPKKYISGLALKSKFPTPPYEYFFLVSKFKAFSFLELGTMDFGILAFRFLDFDNLAFGFLDF